MSEHYPRTTESVTKWCNHCWAYTRHAVSDGRVGRCEEHDAPHLSKKQQKDLERPPQNMDLFA